jgi:NADH-quinone oxidoreductase subunit H
MDAIRAFVEDHVSAQIFVSIHVLMIMLHVILIVVAYSVFLERKISAYIQDRIGPNRVGFDFGLPALKILSTDGPLKGVLGLGQPLADGIKFLLKEDYTPGKVDKFLFTLAPVLIIIPALIGFAVIPWGGFWDLGDIPTPLGTIEGGRVVIAGADVNIGIVYLLAVASLGVYGVTLGGWASNSKYSFLGGLRATAQMISYEIPLGLSLLAALLVVGSVLPTKLIDYQVQHGWLVLAQPMAALLFFIAILAEANRAPFDNAEAEQELVGGYHTEYSSMRFALFFLAEYAHMVTSAAFLVLLFFGGYHLPLGWLGLGENHWLSPEATGFMAVLAKVAVFLGKVVLVICFEMLIRWTLPRLRYDQVMMLGWQSLIPISLTVVVVTSVMVYLGQTPADYAGTLGAFAWAPMFAVNLILFLGVLAFQNTLPKSTANRRLRLYGSRFYPVFGDSVASAPSHAMALEDRPVQGTVSGPV